MSEASQTKEDAGQSVKDKRSLLKAAEKVTPTARRLIGVLMIASGGLLAELAGGINEVTDYLDGIIPNANATAGVIVTNPLTGQETSIGISVATKASLIDMGLPESVVDKMGPNSQIYRAATPGGIVYFSVYSLEGPSAGLITLYGGGDVR